MDTVNHISMKRENYMIISVGTEKALKKKINVFMIKKKKINRVSLMVQW